jgi:hypothetical protein
MLYGVSVVAYRAAVATGDFEHAKAKAWKEWT